MLMFFSYFINFFRVWDFLKCFFYFIGYSICVRVRWYFDNVQLRALQRWEFHSGEIFLGLPCIKRICGLATLIINFCSLYVCSGRVWLMTFNLLCAVVFQYFISGVLRSHKNNQPVLSAENYLVPSIYFK